MKSIDEYLAPSWEKVNALGSRGTIKEFEQKAGRNLEEDVEAYIDVTVIFSYNAKPEELPDYVKEIIKEYFRQMEPKRHEQSEEEKERIKRQLLPQPAAPIAPSRHYPEKSYKGNTRFAKRMKDFEQSEFYRNLEHYVTKDKGRRMIPIKGYGNARVGGSGTLAALVTDGYSGVIVANGSDDEFEANVSRFAQHYLPWLHVSQAKEAAKTYLALHENYHRSQGSLRHLGVEGIEKDVEKGVYEHASKMASRYGHSKTGELYRNIANIASKRLGEVARNYGRVSHGSSGYRRAA